MVFVVGLIDNDEPDRPTPPYSSAYLINSTCCCCLSRKTGSDDLADCPDDQKLYQPFPQPSDTPCQYEQKTCIAGLLCMDALTWPTPQTPSKNNCERHDTLKACTANTGTGVPVLCVPARMTSRETKNIEGKWPDVHFVLANACPPSESNTHPSVVRIKDGSPVMFPDQLTLSGQHDALVVEPLEVGAPGTHP